MYGTNVWEGAPGRASTQVLVAMLHRQAGVRSQREVGFETVTHWMHISRWHFHFLLHSQAHVSNVHTPGGQPLAPGGWQGVACRAQTRGPCRPDHSCCTDPKGV